MPPSACNVGLRHLPRKRERLQAPQSSPSGGVSWKTTQRGNLQTHALGGKIYRDIYKIPLDTYRPLQTPKDAYKSLTEKVAGIALQVPPLSCARTSYRLLRSPEDPCGPLQTPEDPRASWQCPPRVGGQGPPPSHALELGAMSGPTTGPPEALAVSCGPPVGSGRAWECVLGQGRYTPLGDSHGPGGYRRCPWVPIVAPRGCQGPLRAILDRPPQPPMQARDGLAAERPYGIAHARTRMRTGAPERA
jgi:hypothetical protein